MSHKQNKNYKALPMVYQPIDFDIYYDVNSMYKNLTGSMISPTLERHARLISIFEDSLYEDYCRFIWTDCTRYPDDKNGLLTQVACQPGPIAR